MHKSVLLQESIDALNLAPGKTFVDGTFGGGGHSRAVRERFGDSVKIIGLDRDPDVREASKGFDVRTMSFSDIDSLELKADAILLDLGISSIQLESSGRGFSFQKEEPLDMRMSHTGLTAADILNSWDESAIELILKGFGEEKYAHRIAKQIATVREMKPIQTTTDLIEIVDACVPSYYKRGRIHPATRTFQALRIAVNEELTVLEVGLEKCLDALNPEGRLGVITFHSLEDRIVKNIFRDHAKLGEAKLITKKPIVPSLYEVKENPRSRSAKLRVIEKNYEK